MSMSLTDRERAVLAHVVLDPDGWLAHSEAVFGEVAAAECLAAKVVRHESAYDAAVAAEGESYQTRAEREVG